MNVLVTGATGVIGVPTTRALLERGHRVTLYSRHASDHLRLWPERVRAVDGSLSDTALLERAMIGCEAVIHLAGIVSERSGTSFEEVNVEGTRRVMEAASRAAVRRFIYVSSLGAERGRSRYHQSKRSAEAISREFPREWVVLRPGNVYGPGDEVISLLLKLVRVSPVVPAIDGGDHSFQPMWVDDLAQALAASVERPDLVGRELDLAGPDVTSMNDLIDRLRNITGCSPVRVPVPGFLGVLGARAAGLLGLNVPLDGGQVTMLEEGSLIPNPRDNALTSVFGIRATPLSEGLRRLADSSPEQEPADGVGSLVRRHVWADIIGSRLGPEALFERFRALFGEITPWHVMVGAEPGTPVEPRLGATLTMRLPLRGNVQVRVVELEPLQLTLATLDGHPLAGLVRFRIERISGEQLRFHVEVHDRPSNMVDWLVMSTVGGGIQVATWRSTVDRLVAESGGSAPDGVRDESETLRGEDARRVEQWARDLMAARKRALHESGASDTADARPRAGAGSGSSASPSEPDSRAPVSGP